MRIDNRATIAGAKILTGAKVLNGFNMSHLRELVTGSPPMQWRALLSFFLRKAVRRSPFYKSFEIFQTTKNES